MPYRIFSGVRFYEHMEIKDILAYLKAINNPADDMAYLRIINVPRRGIGNVSINKVQFFASENGLTFSAAISRAKEIPGLGKKAADIVRFADFMAECTDYAVENSVAKLIQKILRDTNYMETILDGTPEGQEREANVQELLAKAAAFENESDDVSLGKFLEDVALVADVDNYEEGANAVTLMTLHSAKGLEFDTVFIVGVEENLFPTSRSIDSGSHEEIEEERRLCYVGFTRAKRLLYLSHAFFRRRFDQIARNQPSRFVADVPPECITQVNSYGRPKEFVSSQARAASGFERSTNDLFASGRSRSAPTQKAYGAQGLSQLAAMGATKGFTPAAPPRPTPKSGPPEFFVGDKVRMAKYGVGEVLAIDPAGADYEVTIQFEGVGRKKFMANLLRVTKEL